MKKILFGVLALMFIITLQTNTLQAQSTTFENITSIQLANSGVIRDSQGVKGYYFFYKKEKINSEMNTYILKIIDENLNEVTNKEITDNKELRLLSGRFNGEVLILKFFDYRKRELSFRSFSIKGKLIEINIDEVKNRYQLSPYATQIYDSPGKLYAVGTKGFVDYEAKKDKYYAYKILFLPTDGKSKKWTSTSSKEVKSISASTFLYADNDVLLSTIITRPRLLSTKNTQTFISSSNLDTGLEEWSTELTSTQYELFLLNSYTNKEKNEITLFGSYFKKGDDITKAKNLGIFSIVMNIITGEIKNSNYISWENHVNNFLPTNKKGKITDVGYIYFHNFFKTADGHIFGIGEQYHKSASPLGIASHLMGGTRGSRVSGIGGSNGVNVLSVVKILIKNFYIFEFNDDFSLKGIKIIEKGKSSFDLPAGYGTMPVARLGLIMKAYRAFDFEFIQSQDEGEVMHIGYFDYDRRAKKGSKSYFGAITYADGEFTQDKIVLKNEERNLIRFYPAKAGHILVTEYNQKKRQLDIRLEAINF